MDGVDAAIFRITPAPQSHQQPAGNIVPKLKFEMLGKVLYEFEPAFQKKLKSIIASGQATLDDICRMDAALGEVFAQAALSAIKVSSLSNADIDLIGSHGQTIWHSPQAKSFGGMAVANTLQLGQSAIIAERTGIDVISDFRVQDMSVGGQGAPLVSFADEILFGSEGYPLAILNIGGISNITVIDQHGKSATAFDTGPGNTLIDRCAEKLFSRPFDERGTIAKDGVVNEQFLIELLENKYFRMPPPKTTGRELFGAPFADELITLLQTRTASPKDIIATVSALTSASIANQYKKFIQNETRIEKIVLGGGGAENDFIKAELIKRWPHELKLETHEDFGISTKFKESLLFALLAYAFVCEIPSNVPACTGASKRVFLGKLAKASR